MPNDEDATNLDHTDSGQFERAYSDEEFLNAIDAIDELAYSKTIAAEVGCSADLVRRRMPDLEDKGLCYSEDVGGTKVWFRPA